MELKKISDIEWEIPKTGKMNVPGIIYASEELLKDIEKDKALEQVKNVSQLPGIIDYSIALPDAHQGYGFPIGGVAAFDLEKGIISPGGVGYDINCGVRLLKTNLKKKDISEDKMKKEIVEKVYKKVPSGVGRGSSFQISKKELNEILEKGARYMVERGYGNSEDLKNIEENGCLKNADSSKVSERAIKRGIGQLGTLGAGNHFLEFQIVDKIYDDKIAKRFGLEEGQLLIMIHCGSRGLGHQVASDYIKLMEKEYGFKNLPDRELIHAPIKSKLGQDYLSAMNCAANFAFANRQLITFWTKEALKEIFPNIKVDLVYDVCHNIAKIEEHIINKKGEKEKVCVHRKGAARSFENQPVLIPGSMGTASYFLIGTKRAEELTFGSTVHGAGRVKSRISSLKEISGEKVKKILESQNIEVKAGSLKSLSEESPSSYKDIDEVVKVVDELGLSKKIARMKPFIVIKG